MVPGGLVHYRLLDAEIESAVSKLREQCPEVAAVAYSLREDSLGEPSIFFRVALTDEATIENIVNGITNRIETLLMDEVRPIENWGLRAYFNYRRHSEYQDRMDTPWA